MKFLICGAGPVGLYFGSRLANGGAEVTYLELPHIQKALAKQNLTIHPLSNKTYSFQPKIETDPSQIETPDVILICVKSYNTFDVAVNLVPFIHPDLAILSLQNGIGNERIIANIMGKDFLLGAIHEFSGILKEKNVYLTSPAKIFLGELQPKKNDKRVQKIAQFFSHCNIENQTLDNITHFIWAKFIWNCIVLPISVLTRSNLQEIKENKELWSVEQEMLEEILQVAQKQEPQLSKDYVQKYFLEKPAPATKSSMLKDLEAGKKLELEELSGEILKIAEKSKIQLPICRSIYNIVKAIEFRGLLEH